MSTHTRVPRALVWCGLLLAQLLPAALAYWLCACIAALLRRLQARMYRVLRHNLAHVAASDSTASQLDAMAEQALALALRTYYESFRSTATGGRWQVEMIVPTDCTLLRRDSGIESRGVMICGLHIANFDAAGAWLAQHGIDVQVLSLANPDPGTEMINTLRRKQGLHITPVDPGALRAAIRRLRAGGLVLTGIDRPADGGNQPLTFFGETTAMPVGHVRLAMQAGVPVVLMACYQQAPGVYCLACSDPIKMQHTGDRSADTSANATRLLALAEVFIRKAPEQWLVFVPVWPPEA